MDEKKKESVIILCLFIACIMFAASLGYIAGTKEEKTLSVEFGFCAERIGK